MPNIKSAKKRVLVNQKKTEQNKAIRSEVKTAIKKIELLLKENKPQEAKASLSEAFSVIDSACSKNIIHANNAANKKAKLAKKVDDALAALASTPMPLPLTDEKVAVAPVPETAAEPAPEEKKTKKTAKKAETAEEKPAKKPAAKKTAAKKKADAE